jgi:signal peptidase I
MTLDPHDTPTLVDPTNSAATPAAMVDAAAGEPETPGDSEISIVGGILGKTLYVIKEVVITILLFLVLRNLVVQARYIPSASMHPGLLERDRLLVEVVTKHFTDVQRGQILVFYRPGEPKPNLTQLLESSFGFYDDKAMIKRVIGLPGDTVEVVPNIGVFVNGTLLEEDYTAEKARDHFGPETVPEGHLFMMGDNRNQSSDSRMWGYLPIENIIGKALVRFYPFNRVGMIH